jgi:hypothetical protein
MFLDVEGGSDWVNIAGYYCLIIGKITNKGSDLANIKLKLIFSWFK